VSSEQRISDERLASIEARCASIREGGPGLMDFGIDAADEFPQVIADLRAARAEIERYKEAAVQRAVVDMGTPWQCSGCGHVYRGRLKRACDVCHRAGYYSGSVHREALAKYDAKQAARIRAGGGAS
jgi:rubrerythrin